MLAEGKNKYSFIIEKTDTGFSAYASDLHVYTTGRDLHELQANCLEALQLYFADQTISLSYDDLRLEIDLKQFFRYYRVINGRFLARRIGMNPSLLSQYVRGHKRPSVKQQQKILRGIQEIGKELADIGIITK